MVSGPISQKTGIMNCDSLREMNRNWKMIPIQFLSDDPHEGEKDLHRKAKNSEKVNLIQFLIQFI